jgi:hypothetical protein
MGCMGGFVEPSSWPLLIFLLQLQQHLVRHLVSQIFSQRFINPPIPPISKRVDTYNLVHFKPTISTWEGYGRVMGGFVYSTRFDHFALMGISNVTAESILSLNSHERTFA